MKRIGILSILALVLGTIVFIVNQKDTDIVPRKQIPTKDKYKDIQENISIEYIKTTQKKIIEEKRSKSVNQNQKSANVENTSGALIGRNIKIQTKILRQKIRTTSNKQEKKSLRTQLRKLRKEQRNLRKKHMFSKDSKIFKRFKAKTSTNNSQIF